MRPGWRSPTRAGAVYGRALAYLDARTLTTWSELSGFRLELSRWYAQVFGYPELAAHRRYGRILERLRNHGGETMLDLGAGNGLYSIGDAVRRDGSAHVLADVSLRHMKRAVATGRSLGLSIWGIACSAEALPLANESFDAVLLVEVLQFVDDDKAAVEEIARVLRPGGVWVCEQERPPRGATIAGAPESRLQKRRVGYSEELLCGLAAAAGMVLEDSEMVSGRVGRWWESLDGRIFRKSRTLHFAVFPLSRLLAWLSIPTARHGQSGTVLYLFRKRRTVSN